MLWPFCRLVACCLCAVAVATPGPCEWPNTCPGTVPKMQQTWLTNKSTIIMPCNNTGFTDPESTRGWGIVDFDWSNAKGLGTTDGWAKHRPMDDEELMFEQVKMTVAASPSTTAWVYKNVVYGYPWVTAIRKILEDPAYSDWWMPFKPEGPWYSSKCDFNYNPPLCSDKYHSQEQTPDYPHGDGDCTAPACDCGKVPCGFYVFNHASQVKVNGQSFQDWFIYSYMFNELGSSPMVSGFFWDNVWNEGCDIHDQVPHTCDDMGLSGEGLKTMTAAFETNMEALRTVVLDRGMFTWQMLWTGGPPNNIGATGVSPLVRPETCAANLRELCQADSPAQTRAMMYAFEGTPEVLKQHMHDLVNFLLVRGPYAWLGHSWKGCSHMYEFPPELHGDYGEPLALCHETSPGSQVFRREWTKALVQMDCNTWTPTIEAASVISEEVVV